MSTHSINFFLEEFLNFYTGDFVPAGRQTYKKSFFVTLLDVLGVSSPVRRSPWETVILE